MTILWVPGGPMGSIYPYSAVGYFTGSEEVVRLPCVSGISLKDMNKINRYVTATKHNKACSMMTSSNGNIFRVTGPLCGEFTGPGEFPAQRPVTRSFDVFFDLRPNKRLSKQPWCWWFETPSWSLWRQANVESCAYLSGRIVCVDVCSPQ